METLHLLIASLGTLLAGAGAVVAAIAKRHAKEANDAVNHVGESRTPRLYDLALMNDARSRELLEWKRGYDGGPLSSGEKVEQFWAEWNDVLQAISKCPNLPANRGEDHEDCPAPDSDPPAGRLPAD